jgi:hypothetical protein
MGRRSELRRLAEEYLSLQSQAKMHHQSDHASLAAVATSKMATIRARMLILLRNVPVEDLFQDYIDKVAAERVGTGTHSRK